MACEQGAVQGYERNNRTYTRDLFPFLDAQMALGYNCLCEAVHKPIRLRVPSSRRDVGGGGQQGEKRAMRIFGRRSPARVATALVLVALLSLLSFDVAFANEWGQPTGITDQARDMHDLYKIVLLMAVVVFVAVEGALLFIILRFRRKSDELPPQIHGNNLLEVIWTTIPVIIVVILFVFSFIVLVDVEEEADEDALTINVTGFQFSWEFVYNTNDLGVGTNPNAENQTISILGTGLEEPELVIPVNEPVEFTLNATDVIHSFYVRDFLYKLDLIPGRDNKFQVTARETGTYSGQCAELCGINHALMRFSLRVVTREEFDRWIQERLEEQRTARQPEGR